MKLVQFRLHILSLLVNINEHFQYLFSRDTWEFIIVVIFKHQAAVICAPLRVSAEEHGNRCLALGGFNMLTRTVAFAAVSRWLVSASWISTCGGIKLLALSESSQQTERKRVYMFTVHHVVQH